MTNGAHHKERERLHAINAPLANKAENLLGGIYERCKKHSLSRAKELCSKQFFMDWLTRQPNCPCCGIAFDLSPRPGFRLDASPSIDRFDSARGYELDNIELICWRCNNIKRNYTAADLMRVAKWMDRRATWGNDKPYDGTNDFAKSLDVGYAAIRERMAAGGKGWEPKA